MTNFISGNGKILLSIIIFLIGINLYGGSLDYLNDLPPLIDRDLFFGDPKIAGAKISPDGKYISFLKPYKDVRNIYVKKRGEPFEEAKPVTADDRPVSGYFWSQDSRYILYVQDKGGNENFHVYAVDPTAEPNSETGVPQAKDLTPLEAVRATIYSVPENTPDKIMIGLNQRDPSYHDVYEVSISTGKREQIFKNTQNISDYTFDLKGNLRLASRETEDGGTEILRNNDGKFERIYKCGFEERCYAYRFHKNNEKVYFVTNKGEKVDLTRLTLLDPETGETELVEYDPQNEVDFGGALFDDRTEELIATMYVGNRKRIYPKNEEFKDDVNFLKKKLPDGELSISSTSEDMQYYLVSVSRDIDPGSVYLYDRKQESVKLLYKSRPALESKNLAHMKALSYKARDGMEIPAYLTLPRGVRHKNLPVVMLIHGGPWSRDSWGYDPYAQFLANRGYAVFQPNFRGSSGFGKEFLNAGNKEWGTGYMQHDISDGVKYLIEAGYADPEKVAIFGGSYGGYATLAGLTFTPELYTAGISYVGPSNLLTLLNSLPPYWEPVKKMFYKRVGNPNTEEGKKQLKKQSPLFSADNIDDPLLVIQGANDPRVKKQESDQIVVAAREKGLDVAYLVAPNEGHGFRQLDNRLVVAAAMEKFLAKQLGGRYQEKVSDNIRQRWEELRVNVDSVEMPDTSFIQGEAKADFPDIDPDKLKSYTAIYKQIVDNQGREITLDFDREIKKSRLKGADTWLVIKNTETPGGSSVDSFYLSGKDCLPVKRIIVQRGMEIVVKFEEGQITGTMEMGPRTNEIDIKPEEKVLGLPDVLAMTMKIAPDFKAQFGALNLMRQNVQQNMMEVVGQEKVKVPAGSFNAYKVEIKPINGGEGKQTLFLTVDEPHIVLKSIENLPSRMGGGTVISELKSTSLME
ncbi:MAG: S9 family peptidase [Candidatus Marinimicrobia bacterium]|nr:S9 family peptidase [Candidatus Neomarinimicrobiota bacterium]